MAYSQLALPGPDKTLSRTGERLLTGQVQMALDQQRRLQIPSMFRPGMGDKGVRIFSASQSELWIFPEDEFAKLIQTAKPALATNDAWLDVTRLMLHRAEFSPLDAASRMRISIPILERHSLSPGSRVLLSGSGNFLEVTACS